MTKEIENLDLEEFLYSIQNLINSKFLMLESSVSAVLQSIASTERVYGLIAQCMINFDFATEWKQATTETALVLPEDNSKKIAFIFCMLTNIDDKNLDIVALLKHYYSSDESASPYEIFCNEIVLEFKNSILQGLGINESTTESSNEDELEENIAETYQLLYNAVRLLNDKVLNANKIKVLGVSKEDLVAIISSFELAIRENHSEYFYAFLASIKGATQKAKELKSLVNDIEFYSSKIIKRG